MEAISVGFVFVIYLIVRLLLGHHKNKSYKDTLKYREGIEMVEAKHYKEGLDYFTGVLQQDEKCGVAWAHRGRCHQGMGDAYQALADCTKAVHLDYNLKDCYLIRGKALYALENYEGACVEFGKAVWHFKNTSVEALRGRGLCYLKLGEYAKAEQDFTRALSLGDEESNYFLLGLRNRQDVF